MVHLVTMFILYRGFRQGCPLSPLLYVLFIEPVARYINSNSKIHGFKIPGSHGQSVKFLQYADDATCISTCDLDIYEFINVFKMFQRATGASINTSKSNGLKLGSLTSVYIQSDILWSQSSIKITGVLFGSNETVNCNWTQIVNSVKKLLSLYQNRHLSLVGKVMLINTVIYPKFYFVAPIYPIPDWVIKETCKAVFTFIWGFNKPDLVSRKVVVLNKDLGGLGLDDLKVKMNALFVKPFFTLLVNTCDPPLYLALGRYFLAKPLRTFFPHLWSNAKPQADSCPGILLRVYYIINMLINVNFSFSEFAQTKNVVNSLSKSDVIISVVSHNPTFPWDKIWPLAFNKTLDNKH